MLIKETFLLTATDSDVLAAPARLAAIPADGMLTIEASCTQCSATNNAQLTLQLAEGDIPFQDLIIPMSGGASGTGEVVVDRDTAMVIQMQVKGGGHIGLAYLETGTVNSILIIVTWQN